MTSLQLGPGSMSTQPESPENHGNAQTAVVLGPRADGKLVRTAVSARMGRRQRPSRLA